MHLQCQCSLNDKWEFAVAYVALRPGQIGILLEFRNVGFCGIQEETRRTRGKTLGAGARTNVKQTQPTYGVISADRKRLCSQGTLL